MILTQNLRAAFNTSASRRLYARLPRGTRQLMVTPEAACWVRVGDDSVVAAADQGVYCAAGVVTAVRANEGQRIAGLGVADGVATIEVYGVVEGDQDKISGRSGLISQAMDFDFDFDEFPAHINNSGEMTATGRHRGVAAQTTAANIPGDTSINGRSALAFDGSNDVLDVTQLDSLTAGIDSFVMAAAFQIDAAPVSDAILAKFSVNGGANARFQIGVTSTLGALLSGRVLDLDSIGGFSGGLGAIRLGEGHVIVAKWDCQAAELSLWINDKPVLTEVAWANVTAGATSATASQDVEIGDDTFAGRIGQVVGKANPPADFNYEKLSANLRKIWGVREWR